MSTAKNIKTTAKDFQSSAESAVENARSGLHDAADEMAYQTESMKRNPVAMTLLTLLGLAVIGAVIAILKNKS